MLAFDFLPISGLIGTLLSNLLAKSLQITYSIVGEDDSWLIGLLLAPEFDWFDFKHGRRRVGKGTRPVAVIS